MNQVDPLDLSLACSAIFYDFEQKLDPIRSCILVSPAIFLGGINSKTHPGTTIPTGSEMRDAKNASHSPSFPLPFHRVPS
jgi:hypothetical protein